MLWWVLRCLFSYRNKIDAIETIEAIETIDAIETIETINRYAEGTILAFNKPYGWTSFQVVARVRWLLKKYAGLRKMKVGHAGTLDPLATGVLIICTGKATKRIEELQAGRKEYVATLKLGATTPSFDKESEEDATYPTNHITEEMVREVLKRFLGETDQVPPVFSAVKINGKRAYKFARKGEEVELAAKRITIDEIELMEFKGSRSSRVQVVQEVQGVQGVQEVQGIQELKIRVVCSKGTYIRALARDIGKALGSGAYLTDLFRTRVGDYRLTDCLDPETWRPESDSGASQVAGSKE